MAVKGFKEETLPLPRFYLKLGWDSWELILSEKQGLAPFIKIRIAESKLPERKTSFSNIQDRDQGQAIIRVRFFFPVSQRSAGSKYQTQKHPAGNAYVFSGDCLRTKFQA